MSIYFYTTGKSKADRHLILQMCNDIVQNIRISQEERQKCRLHIILPKGALLYIITQVYRQDSPPCLQLWARLSTKCLLVTFFQHDIFALLFTISLYSLGHSFPTLPSTFRYMFVIRKEIVKLFSIIKGKVHLCIETSLSSVNCTKYSHMQYILQLKVCIQLNELLLKVHLHEIFNLCFFFMNRPRMEP